MQRYLLVIIGFSLQASVKCIRISHLIRSTGTRKVEYFCWNHRVSGYFDIFLLVILHSIGDTFITAHKRSLRRLCFYTCLSVILFTRVCLPQCMLGCTPQSRRPPGADTPSPTVHAGRYGQQAGGTHPTGMHTC